MKMKDIFRYLAMFVVIALPMIIGFAWGYLFEQNIAVEAGYTYSYIRPSLSLSFYVELLWFFPVAIFILPKMVGKISEKVEPDPKK
ncbi:MAG: hypothetical protein WCD81_07590 [Candidatus Bathyarchaeia archaeon]